MSDLSTPTKTVLLSARIDPDLKKDAEAVFDALGLSMTDAIRMFLTRAVAEQALPIPTEVPNRFTRRAIADVNAGRGVTRHRTTKALFAHLRKQANQ